MARFAAARFAAAQFVAAQFVATLVALALAACQPAKPTLDPNAEPIARAFFDEVRTGADLDADTHLAHELKNPTSEEQLTVFRSLIPVEPPRSIELKSWEARTDAAGTTTKLTELYRYADRTLVAQTALFKSPSGEDPVIIGFNLTEQDQG
jgi:hypothetical protein